jgi:prepilin-type N-terminal cleavage/methylation domain-containing protein
MPLDSESGLQAAMLVRRAFTILEVILVMAIIGLMIICLVGFVLSRKAPPLTSKPRTTPAPAVATPAPGPAK